jgi:hypothetical protein
VEHQDRRALADVEVGKPEIPNGAIAGLVGKARQTLETHVRCPEGVHAAGPYPPDAGLV